MVDHGIRHTQYERTEVEAFVDIGMHLKSIGASVPQIYDFDTFSGMVILQDLGDIHLQQIAAKKNDSTVQDLYRKVIVQWLHMAIEGYRNFNILWTYQSSHYDREVILDKECRYFLEAFIGNYLGIDATYADYQAEFNLLADLALKHGLTGFMHRDLQSRNIMTHNDHIWFIDFQGGRLGPLQYDLASLLIDPYVNLADIVQDQLYEFTLKTLSNHLRFDSDLFKKGFDYCSLTRNLQMLGAFGFLSRVKGKTQFETYIPSAVTTLQHNLIKHKDLFPKLIKLIDRIVKALKID